MFNRFQTLAVAAICMTATIAEAQAVRTRVRENLRVREAVEAPSAVRGNQTVQSWQSSSALNANGQQQVAAGGGSCNPNEIVQKLTSTTGFNPERIRAAALSGLMNEGGCKVSEIKQQLAAQNVIETIECGVRMGAKTQLQNGQGRAYVATMGACLGEAFANDNGSVRETQAQLEQRFSDVANPKEGCAYFPFPTNM